MLYKLRIALTLLIVGLLSGGAIVFVHTVTEDRIQENRELAELEDYQEIFPDMARADEEDIDHDVIDRRAKIYNADDEQIGEIYRGHDTNNFGDITVLVGITMDFEIKQVLVSQTENTPNYYQDMPLENLAGQSTEDITYDTNTGATASYNSVQMITDYAVELFYEFQDIDLRSSELQALETIYGEDADDYIEHFTFEDEAVHTEYRVIDENEATLGYAYDLDIDGELVMLGFTPDDEFLGIASDDDAHDDLSDVFADFEDLEGDMIKDIDVDALEGDQAIIDAFAFIQDLVEDTERIEEEYLVRYRETDEGYVITGFAEGFNAMNVIEVTLSDDGEITNIALVRTDDTDDYVEDYIEPNLDAFDGESDIDFDDALDTFAGATETGESIVNVLRAALDYYDVLGGSVEMIDHDVLTSREQYFDEDGDLIGLLYRGEAEGFNATNVFDVVIDEDGAIYSIEIVETEDTESYLDDYIYPNLEDFIGETDVTQDDTDDAFAGATASGDSIYEMLSAALSYHADNPEFGAGDDDDEEDPRSSELQAIEDAFGEDDLAYDVHYQFPDADVLKEYIVSNSDGDTIGYAYTFDLDGAVAVVALDSDDAFLGFGAEVDAQNDHNDAVDALIGEPIEEADLDDFDLVDDKADALAFVQSQITDYRRVIDYGSLAYAKETDDTHVYIGVAEGHNDDNHIEIAVNFDGTIASVDLIHTDDTNDWLDDYIYDELEALVGKDSVDDLDADDTFAGATNTGESILEVAEDVLFYDGIYGGERELSEAFGSILLTRDHEDGKAYTGKAEGHNNDNYIEVVIDDNGEVTDISFIHTDDTPGWLDDYIYDELDTLFGKDSVEDLDADDTFAGASNTGESILKIVQDALDYHLIYGEDYESIDHDVLILERDTDEGTAYIGVAEGHNDDNYIEIIIDDNGAITGASLLLTSDTPGWLDDYIYDELDALIGESSVDVSDADDTFAGATNTGHSILSVADAALTFHAEGGDE